ncbi:unnamed protein product [Rhizoctonia solani]|uniref:Uncharacterized protein n=1 Tax=Rhizoctonia solani TaxID=456999 RepID=A0A8H3C3Y1_9AGAM|nr:unnamed protein product [Rhizoctonia solani]CAE6474342.1 unnamed protein product [Rhizoctonia solani]
MRTQEDSPFFNPENESGDDWETKLDDDSPLQHGLDDIPKRSGPLPGKKSRNGPANKPEVMAKSIAFRVQDVVVSICNLQVVKIVSILCLVFFMLRSELPMESLCKIPALAGYSSHCARKIDPPKEPAVTPDFIALAGLQTRLEQVMKDSASSSKVAIDIKNSEIGLRDLATVVKHSTLSKKDILWRDLRSFVDEAKATGTSLQQLGSRVWGAVDKVISLNKHTLLMLESASASEGELQIWWGVPSKGRDPKDIENIWLQSIVLLHETLRKLIHEAQHNIGSLQRLEERLNNIADMVVEEKHDIIDKELACDLGTKLKQHQWSKELFGKNTKEWQSHSVSQELLERIKNDRQQALNYVTEVLLRLKRMSNDLDDLREGVAEPIVIAGLSNIPIQSHIEHIRNATERLVNGQIDMRRIEDDYRKEQFLG